MDKLTDPSKVPCVTKFDEVQMKTTTSSRMTPTTYSDRAGGRVILPERTVTRLGLLARRSREAMAEHERSARSG
jgi:hypothetical protein